MILKITGTNADSDHACVHPMVKEAMIVHDWIPFYLIRKTISVPDPIHCFGKGDCTHGSVHTSFV